MSINKISLAKQSSFKKPLINTATEIPSLLKEDTIANINTTKNEVLESKEM